jgi:hypothetical protein
VVSRFGIPVGNGTTVPAVHMARILDAESASAA